MKKLTIAIILAASAVTAFASCPIGTKYQCYPTGNGKMMCGCF
jgi:hypothetical protein